MQKDYYSLLQYVDLESLITDEVLKSYATTRPALAEETRRYLHLIGNSGEELLSPSKAVDEVYHEILETAEIRAEVEQILGGTLLHEIDIPQDGLNEMYRKTLSSYQHTFKSSPSDSKLW